MSTRRLARPSEQGFVMVPVIALLIVALGLGLAVLAVVDTQTSQGRTQRSSDAAQTLAEGVVTATANVLASDQAVATWPTTGVCQTIAGDLSTAPVGATSSLAHRVTTEVQARFAGTSGDYASLTRSTNWTVSVCPVAGTGDGTSWTQTAESRWSDAFLTRTVNSQPAGAPPAQLSLWVRGQAAIRTGDATAARPAKAVASKVRQSVVGFAPPAGFAVGTGSFSTDVTTALGTVQSGSLLTNVLGTKPLIADSTSNIGVRCGLLATLSNPSTVCLSGAFAGVAGATNALGLGTLNTMLGLDRAKSLGTWTMAPSDAVAAYKSAAQSNGVYKATVGSGGDVRTPSTPPTGAPECFTEPTTSSSVVYIGKVGNGEGYCTVSGTRTVKMLIVERGGVRITGALTGVVYALNLQECTQSDGTCSAADRTGAVNREVVRIEGNTGKVIGSAWADGAGGTVGIYPGYATTTAANTALLGNVCNLPVIGPILSTLGSTLTAVTGLVNTLLSTKRWRYPAGVTSSTTGCQLLTAQLGTLTSSQLLTIFANGGSMSIVTAEYQTRSSILSPWPSTWLPDPDKTVTVQMPALTADVIGALTATLSNYTAIQYDAATVSNASAQLPTGAGPVVGTFRNVSPN